MSGRTHSLDTVPGLRTLAQKQRGVVRRTQLAELGVTRHHIRRQVDAERWTTVGTRVVVLGRGILSREQRRWVALVHAGSPAFLAAWTVLECRGARGWEREPAHVVGPQGYRPPPLAGAVFHQSLHLDDVDLLDRPVPSTTVARAAIDAAGWERTDRAACGLLTAVAQQRLATPAAMLEVLDRLGRVPRTAALRRTLTEAAGGAESLAESDVTALLGLAGLPAPRRQVMLDTPVGARRLDVVVDLPDGRTLVVHVDGPHHLDPRTRARDALTDAALIAMGCVVLRIPVATAHVQRQSILAQFVAIAEGARRRTS
jgi:very-short-patch-repair endonuclease